MKLLLDHPLNSLGSPEAIDPNGLLYVVYAMGGIGKGKQDQCIGFMTGLAYALADEHAGLWIRRDLELSLDEPCNGFTVSMRISPKDGVPFRASQWMKPEAGPARRHEQL